MYFQKSEVKGKTALVTGAGKGIGKASAIALAEAGADLIILSRTKSDLEKVKKEIIKLKRKCVIYDCDVSNFEELRSIFMEVMLRLLYGGTVFLLLQTHQMLMLKLHLEL